MLFKSVALKSIVKFINLRNMIFGTPSYLFSYKFIKCTANTSSKIKHAYILYKGHLKIIS